jgi:anti-anti-sigma factor
MTVNSLGEHLVKITLVGRLDTMGVGAVETRFIANLAPNGNNAVVDLSGVDFVTSLGIRMLITAARALRARQAKLALFGTQDRVREIFDSVALQQVIAICPTEADALAAVASAE